MDIKWKDGVGNILNANNNDIKYLDVQNDKKTILKKEEVKKIVIEDRLMHLFKDFDNDLAISIVVPKKNKKDAAKIFNKYDKTGKILKRNTGNFFMDLILESSLANGHPLTGIVAILLIVTIALATLVFILESVLGDVGVIVSRILIIGFPIYLLILRINLRINRKRIKEKR